MRSTDFERTFIQHYCALDICIKSLQEREEHHSQTRETLRNTIMSKLMTRMQLPA